jgi:type I site-specific restriction endonuclease
MTKITKRQVDTAYEIYLALYQGVSGTEESKNIYKQFTRGFFDLIVIDECHRGSAADDSAWREILEYFSAATQIGLTATPKETKEVSNIDYFGEPIYTYSLKQGIEDGFLAPYKVVRIDIDRDLEGWQPAPGELDKYNQLIEDKLYTQKRQRDYFHQYSEKARAVLDALLDKYADEGIENIENINDLRVQPFDKIGTPIEIVKLFGNKQKYLEALQELKNQLYMAS